MTTEQMRFFLEAARLLNFTAAAENLYTTQPTLSRQIMSLEKELDVQLFVRRNNTVTLTSAGLDFYTGISKIYDEYIELTSRVQHIGKGISGVLRIGLMEDQLLNETLSQTIQCFQQMRSNVSIQISRMSINAIRQQLIEGTLDIGDVMQTRNVEFTQMTTILQREEQAHLAIQKELCPPSLTLIREGELRKILNSYPLFLPSNRNFGDTDDYRPIERWVTANNLADLHPRVQFVDNIRDLPLYISSGLGVTMVNQTPSISVDPRVRLIPLATHPPYIRIVVCHPDNKNPLLPPFIKLFQEKAGEVSCLC